MLRFYAGGKYAGYGWGAGLGGAGLVRGYTADAEISFGLHLAYDGAGNLRQRFEYVVSHAPSRFTQDGATYYLLTDHLGSPRVITDAQGVVVRAIDYDAYGNIVRDSNPDFAIPFGFAGGLHDPDTGLVRFGYRDYDPETGRWTARDPIGFAGGDTNLYGYVVNNPINGIDPTGLVTVVIHVHGYGIPHSALYVGRDGQNFLYDPAGSYQPGSGEPRGSGDFFEGADADLYDYMQYHMKNGDRVTLIPLNTSPTQEREIIERAIDLGGVMPFLCGGAVSTALGGACGVESSLFPGTLANNARNASCP